MAALPNSSGAKNHVITGIVISEIIAFDAVPIENLRKFLNADAIANCAKPNWFCP